MISIQSSLSELQRCYTLLDGAAESYRELVGHLAEHCVVARDGKSLPMREELCSLAKAVTGAQVKDLPGFKPQLRDWLSGYGSHLSGYVAGLEAQQAAAVRAFEELAASLAQVDDDHDGRIKSTVEKLREIARSPEARSIRNLLRNAAESVEQSVEQIRREHKSTISHFHSEIRNLQRKLDPEKSPGSELMGYVLTRREIQAHVRTLLPGTFSVILLRVRGLKLAASQFGGEVAAQLAVAVAVRLRNLLPVGAAIGRWGDEEFLTAIPSGLGKCGGNGSTPAFSASLAEHLAGVYGCAADGKMVRPSVEITVCSADSGARDAPERALEQLETAALRI